MGSVGRTPSRFGHDAKKTGLYLSPLNQIITLDGSDSRIAIPQPLSLCFEIPAYMIKGGRKEGPRFRELRPPSSRRRPFFEAFERKRGAA